MLLLYNMMKYLCGVELVFSPLLFFVPFGLRVVSQIETKDSFSLFFHIKNGEKNRKLAAVFEISTTNSTAVLCHFYDVVQNLMGHYKLSVSPTTKPYLMRYSSAVLFLENRMKTMLDSKLIRFANIFRTGKLSVSDPLLFLLTYHLL